MRSRRHNEPFRQENITESREHLASAEPDLLELERRGSDVSDELINRVFRVIHSIKGGFGFFGIRKITELSHAMEDLLSRVRNKTVQVTPDLVDALLDGIDKLRLLFDDVENVDDIPVDEVMTKLSGLLGLTSTEARTRESGVMMDPALLKNHPDLGEDRIVEAVKSGMFIYEISLHSRSDLEDKNLTPAGLFEEWEKIGVLLDIMLDFDAVEGLEHCTAQELSYSAILASVLDPDLISAATGIPESQIKRADTSAVHDQLKRPPASVSETRTEERSAGVINEGERRPDREKTGGTAAQSERAEDSLRVKVELLNLLMTLAEELVISRNQLLQKVSLPLRELLESERIFKEFERNLMQSYEHTVEVMSRDPGRGAEIMQAETVRLMDIFRQSLNFKLSDLPGIHTIVQNIDRVTSTLQESTMQTRLQPISVLFDKAQREENDKASKHRNDDVQDILLFDNGGEERLSVELLKVARIEKIGFDRIEHVGEREFVRYETASFPLIRLHDNLPISAPSELGSDQFVLVPAETGDSVAIAVGAVWGVRRRTDG